MVTYKLKGGFVEFILFIYGADEGLDKITKEAIKKAVLEGPHIAGTHREKYLQVHKLRFYRLTGRKAEEQEGIPTLIIDISESQEETEYKRQKLSEYMEEVK